MSSTVPICLVIPGCLALGEWSHHHGYLGHEEVFVFVFVFVLYNSSVYSTTSSLYLLHLFGPFQLFIVLIFSWNVPLVSLIFLKRSLVFPFLLFSSISLHWSLRKAFLSLLVILWNSAFKWAYFPFSPLPFTSFLFSAIYKTSSDNHFAFLHFFFLKMVLITTFCTMSQTSVHSSSSICLSDLIP